MRNERAVVVDSIIVFFLSVILLAGIFLSSAWAGPKELSLSVWSGPEHYHTKALQAWVKDVEARAGGKVKIVIYPGGTLTKGSQAYNGLVKGISATASSCNGWTKGRFPLTRVVDLPLGMKTSVQASLVTWDFYKKFRPKEWDDVKVLYMFNHGHQFFHTQKTVKGANDLKGKRIRSTGNDAPAVSAIGATPVGMSIGEAYISLQKGIVDGILCNFGALKGWKLAEVTKSHLDFAVVGCGFWVAMNKDEWNGLSPELQKIFEEVSEKHVALTGKAWEDADQAGREFARGLGNSIIPVSKEEGDKFHSAFKPLLDKYVKDMEKKGLPGRAALEYVQSLVKKYEGR